LLCCVSLTKSSDEVFHALLVLPLNVYGPLQYGGQLIVTAAKEESMFVLFDHHCMAPEY